MKSLDDSVDDSQRPQRVEPGLEPETIEREPGLEPGLALGIRES